MPQVRILLGAPICCRSRGERIRTSDLLRPRQARYQAALRPAKRPPEVLDLAAPCKQTALRRRTAEPRAVHDPVERPSHTLCTARTCRGRGGLPVPVQVARKRSANPRPLRAPDEGARGADAAARGRGG